MRSGIVDRRGVYYYRVIFKPQTIIPDFDFEGDGSLPSEQR